MEIHTRKLHYAPRNRRGNRVETIDIKGDTLLLDLLSGARAEDLDVFVDHLTDKGEGRLALSAPIKGLLLDSRRLGLYTPVTLRILIRELQQFGGNTVANLARGSGVAYEQIVRDVLRHLGGSSDASTPLEKLELSAVSARLAQHWLDLDDAAKQDYLSELEHADATSVALSDLQIAVLEGGRVAAAIAQRLAQCRYLPNHMLSSLGIAALLPKFKSKSPLVLAPTGIGLATGEAYRVTVPCVMQVAYLRQRRVVAIAWRCPGCGASTARSARFCGSCGYDLRVKSMDTPPLASQQSSQVSPIANTQGNTELTIGSGSGLPMLSITTFASLDASDQLKPLDPGGGAIDRFAPLLQSFPSLAVDHEVVAHRYLKVVVNGPLAPAADGNGLRGFVKGPDGKITEHGRFFEDDRLKNLADGAALLQVASFVAAQKHLADISQKLSEIQERVGRIEAFQHNERKSAINGTLDYLRQAAATVLDGTFSPSVRDELESIERALSEIQRHLRTDIEAAIADVNTLKDPSKFGTSGLTEALQDRQATFEDLVEQWKHCLAARFIACRLVGCYAGERALVDCRHAMLDQLAQSLLGPEGFLVQFRRAVAARSKSMKALTDTKVEIQANQERLHLWEIGRLPTIEGQARATFDQLETMLQENAQPVELVLEMQGNKVVRLLTP